MGQMKRGRVLCQTVVVICGGCGENIAHPENGSLFWMVSELPGAKFSVICHECGETNKIDVPQRAAMPRIG